MIPKILQFWQARSTREQKILLGWAVIVSCSVLYMAVISPLQIRIARLQRSIPTLESQLFAMRGQALQSAPGTPHLNQSQSDLRTTLFQLISTQKHAIDLRSLSPERVELRLPALPAEEALTLLSKLRRDAQAQITMISLSRDKPDGPVRAVLEMERTQ